MQTKHTPGPWTLDIAPAGWVLLSSGPDITAQAFDCSDDDARLIAAAPELLAALRQLVKDADDNSESLKVWRAAHPHFEAARAAIAKATGSQS